MNDRNTLPATCINCKCHIPVGGGCVELKYGYKVRCLRCTKGYRDMEAARGTTEADAHFQLPDRESKKELTQRRRYWMKKLDKKADKHDADV